MPHFNKEFLHLLKNYSNEFLNTYPVFIETGTYYGFTTFAMEPHFNEIHTIEIKEEIYKNTKSKYNGTKINFYLGDSSIILKEVCEKVTESAVFFLDGHWSACDTGKGNKDCPLYEELENIITYFKKSAVIIIDDLSLFGTGPSTSTDICNWEDISEDNIIKITSDRLLDNYILEDRVILSIKPI
jgi:hypothetical protein